MNDEWLIWCRDDDSRTKENGDRKKAKTACIMVIEWRMMARSTCAPFLYGCTLHTPWHLFLPPRRTFLAGGSTPILYPMYVRALFSTYLPPPTCASPHHSSLSAFPSTYTYSLLGLQPVFAFSPIYLLFLWLFYYSPILYHIIPPTLLYTAALSWHLSLHFPAWVDSFGCKLHSLVFPRQANRAYLLLLAWQWPFFFPCSGFSIPMLRGGRVLRRHGWGKNTPQALCGRKKEEEEEEKKKAFTAFLWHAPLPHTMLLLFIFACVHWTNIFVPCIIYHFSWILFLQHACMYVFCWWYPEQTWFYSLFY